MKDRPALRGEPSYGTTTMFGRPHVVARDGDRVSRIFEETDGPRVTAWRCGQPLTPEVVDAIAGAKYGYAPRLTPMEVALNQMLGRMARAGT